MICEKIHRFIIRILFPPGVTPLKLSVIGALYLAMVSSVSKPLYLLYHTSVVFAVVITIHSRKPFALPELFSDSVKFVVQNIPSHDT